MRDAVWPTDEDAANIAADVFRKKLVSQRLYTKKRHRDQEITPQIEFDLRAWAESGKAPYDYFHFKHNTLPMKKLRQRFAQANPELDGLTRYVSQRGNWVNIPEHVEKRLHKTLDRGERLAASQISLSETIDLLEHNGHYPFIKNRSRERELIKKQIPEHIAELFPVARSVERHFVLHVGPTNSGKTHEAITDCEQAETGVYLAPLRLLAMEEAERMNRDGVPCSMVTGEEERLIPGAMHMASTIEMMSEERLYDVAVIDECQMIADRDRGWAWTQAVLGIAAKTVHVCMAPEAQALVTALIEECGDTWEVVTHHRATPLEMEGGGFVFPRDVRAGDALVVFSRKSVLQAASILEDEGRRVSVIYGALPYDARRAETMKFLSGETDVVVATDAIGMGLNLPIRRIIFMDTEKFDGVERRPLKPEEIQQIAGRAGRFGMYDKGWVGATQGLGAIRQGLTTVVPPLTHAVAGFSDLVLQVDFDLLEVLTEWNKMPTVDPYVKLDISRYLSLISKIRELGFLLPKEQELRAANIPFDETEPPLRELFFQFLRLYQQGEPIVQPGHPEGDACTLPELELYCRKLDLYFSFAKAFDCPVDEDKLYDCREEVAEEINEILLHRLKNNIRFCAQCSKALPLHHHGRLCDDCYRRLRKNSGGPPHRGRS